MDRYLEVYSHYGDILQPENAKLQPLATAYPNIMLSKISHTQKNTYHAITLIFI